VLKVTTVGWVVTLALIACLLALDLLISTRRRGAIAFQAALGWSIFYVTVALVFGVVFGLLEGWDLASQYFAGYFVEKSLSVDNLFVFVIILGTFAVPAELQSRALTGGILLALLLRGAMIAAGAALLSAFSFMFLLFGLALVITALQLYRHRDRDPSLEDNPVVTLARRALPVSDSYEGGRMITQVAGQRALTPLCLVLLAIGSTDLLFALDSIPAVFGVTQHPYIVFVANAFALLGLRALFFLVQGLLDRLVYLSVGLAVVLGFIGIKLILHFAHTQSHVIPSISTGFSLIVIAVVLVVITVASLVKTRRDPTARAHAGSLRGPKQRSRSDHAHGRLAR
jgi:tellurite resistance protein TerC